MWIWWGLALALIVGELLMWLEGVERPRAVAWHSGLLLTVLLSHAVLSPFLHVGVAAWWSLHAISRLVIGCCCVGWAILPVLPYESRPIQHGSNLAGASPHAHVRDGA